jgi:hypothetical protein
LSAGSPEHQQSAKAAFMPQTNAVPHRAHRVSFSKLNFNVIGKALHR